MSTTSMAIFSNPLFARVTQFMHANASIENVFFGQLTGSDRRRLCVTSVRVHWTVLSGDRKKERET